jgi:23S rRNA (cytosine1962-C5)-methyltransferase
MNPFQPALETIQNAARRRTPDPASTEAFRLFNGFYEGVPGLVLDRYGSALVIFDHTPEAQYSELAKIISKWALETLEGLDAVLLKQRGGSDEFQKKGQFLTGNHLPDQITEFGVHYALDLQMNRDAGFYLDTRLLRRWLLDNAAGKRLLNTFAYTGSLGVAAGVGGAAEVIQTDISRKFLQFAKLSWELNELHKKEQRILPDDFFRVVGRLRHQARLFDRVILDPPFFSATAAGRVDLQNESARLINKIRPLVAHEGRLVVINNALFLSGADFMAELDQLCRSEYLSFEQIIPIPEDITGYPDTIVNPPPVDPAPFNHPTKIAILRVTRKDQRTS